jgi:glutamine synthetase
MITAEYIWLDGNSPAQLRSKTKVLDDTDVTEMPIWGFDGSSTKQAEGGASDCVLKPVMVTPDPIRGGNNLLVFCEVLNVDMTPHASNTRRHCNEVEAAYQEQEPWFGIEQEYTLIQDGRPLGFPRNGFPAPQGQYYCSVGANNTFGREIAEMHLAVCLQIGLKISGINAEVMPGQWEFQVGPLAPVEVSDHLWMARYLLERIAENYGVSVSYEAKPVKGDWNGAGAHTNFSTKAMREEEGHIEKACEALGEEVEAHLAGYGDGIEDRLTGDHETCSYKDFRFGASDRGASVRIPWQVAKEGKGYIEDRRPNANIDPYVVTRLITGTVCSRL